MPKGRRSPQKWMGTRKYAMSSGPVVPLRWTYSRATALGLKIGPWSKAHQISVYFPDGTCETGIVKSRKEEKDCIRVFGDISNKRDSGFGFGLTPSAFGGALVYRDTDKNKIYEAKFDDLLGGFIFRLKIPSVEL